MSYGTPSLIRINSAGSGIFASATVPDRGRRRLRPVGAENPVILCDLRILADQSSKAGPGGEPGRLGPSRGRGVDRAWTGEGRARIGKETPDPCCW